MSASTERRTYATNPLCAPGAEPSPTSIMELMAKLAEAKSGKSPRPAARGDPNMAAARGDPNMAAARGDRAAAAARGGGWSRGGGSQPGRA